MILSVSGTDRFAQFGKHIRSVASRLPVLSTIALRSMAAELRPTIEANIRAEAPVKTGTLRDSIKASISVVGGTIAVKLTATDYTTYVISGTQAHTIVPRNASVLAFEVAGVLVFARSVNHPGTKPNDFVARGLTRSKPAISAAIGVFGRELFASFGGFT